MKHLIPHDLSPELARQTIDKAFETYKARYPKYNPRLNWRGDRKAEIAMTAKGITLTGVAELQPKAIAVDLEVPFLLRMFKGRAIAVVEREVKKWVERAKAGEL